MDIVEAKNLIIKAGHKLSETGLIVRTWGNISCRIDSERFAITPSGRNYLSLMPEEIVTVNINDCSYISNITPSSEKGIHAEVYGRYPDANFIIHTHQENASVVSAADIDSIELEDPIDKFYFGDKIVCADYALPGTKALRKNVGAALARSKSKALIMKNHGALCFGIDDKEAFEVASELEKICEKHVINRYLKLSGKDSYDAYEMSDYALSIHSDKLETGEEILWEYPFSKRTENGFIMYSENVNDGIHYKKTDKNLTWEASVFNEIYNRYNEINYIIFKNTPEIKAVSSYNVKLKPLLDDFAQIVGYVIYKVDSNPSAITKALKRTSGVLIRGRGALCCGKTKEDAEAVSMITQKNCKAIIGASLFGIVKPIKFFECLAMRINYLKQYSKLSEIR